MLAVFSHSFSVIITTVLYLSDALRKNFLNDKFDYKVGETQQSVDVRLSVWRSEQWHNASKLPEYQTTSPLKRKKGCSKHTHILTHRQIHI